MPVVALKVGRESRAKDLVMAHSGALAGEDGAYEALFDAYGVLRVESLDEMVDTLTLMSSGRRAGPGAFASVHDSGGERAMIIDLAARGGVEFADISAATRDRLAAVLEPGLPPVNPLDAWGTGNAADEIYEECIRALLADDAVAALAFSVDLTTEDDPSNGYIETAKRVWPETDKPMAMLSNLASCDRPAPMSSGWPRRASRCWREPSPGWLPSGTCSSTATSGRGRHWRHHRRVVRSPPRHGPGGNLGWTPEPRSRSLRDSRSWPSTACRWRQAARSTRRRRRSRSRTGWAGPWR